MNEMLSSRKCQAKLVPLALLAALLLLAIIPLAASNLFIDNDRYLLGETVTITVDTEGIGQPQLWIHTSDGNFRFNGALDEQMQYTPANEGYYMITLRDRLDPSFTLEQNFTVTLKTPGNEEENRSGNTTGEAGSAMNVSGNTSENASETEHPLTVTLSTDKTAYSKGETVSIESDTIAEEDWLLYIKTPTEHFRYMGEMDFPLAFPTGAAGAYTIELRNVDGSLLDTLGFMVNTQETPQGDAEPVVPENITGENITAENVTEQNVTETIPLPLLEDETAMNTTENAMTEDPEENVSVEQSGPLTIMDSEGRQGWYVMWKRDPSFFAEVKEFIGLGEADEVKVGETTDVEIIVGSGIIGSMQLDQLQIEDGLRIGVDEVPEENVDELPGRVSNSFALDFSDANFTNGTVTKVAEGQELWKCADWNFTQQRCLGTWVKQQELTPGQEYSFAVYPGDPGYVEILITTAQHLDENRSFIEDIYTEVESRDGVWKEIPANNYVRVTFETELQSFNDITIYARSSSSGRVEVYEKNGTEKLADFGVISEDRKYRILLTNLTGNQDTFDLRVVGGSVEFDYIVDPSTISFDALTSEINPSPFTGIDTVTFSHTTTTDSDRVLVVFVQWLEVSNAYSVDNVSYGGVGLTQLNTEYELAGSRSAAIESWYLVNPPSGANNVVVDWAGSTRNTAVFALTYKGVDQTTPVASNVSAASGGDSATSTVNIDTTNADSLIVAGATHHGGDTDPFSPGSTIVERYDTASGTDTGNHAGFTGGQKTASAVGTHNMNFTASVSDGWVIAAVALNPGNIAPTQSQPIISSSSGTNSSNENLTCSNQSTSDADGDPVKNIYNWYLNSSSLFILNTPFEGGSNSTWTRDYSDNVNHGAVSGATWNATGGYDGWGAYEFDGTNDYIQFQGDDLSTTSSPFSVEFWFTPTTTINSGIGSNIALIEKREGSGANDWYINFESSDVGRMRWRSYSGNVQTTQATWTAGTWYHIVMVYVSNTNATIYVDGVVDNRNSDYDIGSLVQSAEDIWVGTRYDGNDDFDGSIDELRIWNKSLSTEQVFALYQNKTNTIVSEETDIDDVWMCGITPNDGVVDGNQSNSSAMTIIVSPPLISVTQCYEQGVGWEPCGNLAWGDTITQVRSNCTSQAGGSIQNVSFRLTNVDDSKIFFDVINTSGSGDYWEYDVTDVTIQDSGEWNLQVTCRENPVTVSNENWNVSWGTLTATLIDPSTNGNVTQNEFFNFTSQITCTGGECGYINATLDPQSSELVVHDVGPQNLKRVFSSASPGIQNEENEIRIINASHLDSNRNVISNIYGRVKDLDGIWSGLIYENEYIRATFERNLTSDKDITIYARSESGGSIEVYEENEAEKIADFGIIDDDKKYQIFLDSLEGSQDTFDLRVTGAPIEFDYIVDPINQTNFTTVGAQTWQVPTGVTSITVKAWGAGAGGGGGGSHATNGYGGYGGGGGYSQVDIAVTPGETLYIIVGGAGGGGTQQGGAGSGGGGGGRSEVNRTGQVLIVAAGGGGGGGGDNSGGGSPGGNGGAGGGLTGYDGVTSGTAGGGGGANQTSPGAAGTGGATSGTAGSGRIGGEGGDNDLGTTGGENNGGTGGGGDGGLGDSAAFGGGGGAGSGYYGGGGGSASASGDGGAGGAGGGSSYNNGTANSTEAGSGQSAANTGDSDYVGSVGVGGNGANPNGNGVDGNDGRVVFIYAITKGVIPMNSGTPFYTTTANPMYPANNSCLADMKAGDSCNTTWSVNSTGAVNSTWEFFTTYKSLNYSGNVTDEESAHVNLTIIGRSPPIVGSVTLSPVTAGSNNDLNCTFTVTDINLGDTLTANVTWYLNGAYSQSYVVGVDNGVQEVQTLTAGNTSVGQVWHCGVTPSDGLSQGNQVNSSNITIQVSNPPIINLVQCQEDGSSWAACSNVLYADNLTAVRVDCTDSDGFIINATFTLMNVDDGTTFFANTTTDNASGYFVFNNSDMTIEDSGTFRLFAACSDNSSTSVSSTSEWSIPWGSLTASLVSPSSNVNVTRNNFFNFTSSITCAGGECGYINATLDPFVDYFSSFEAGEEGWTHSALGGVDQWHRSSESAHDGSYSWKFGDTGTGNYADSANGGLVTATYDIRTSLQTNDIIASFYHYMNAETGGWEAGKMEYSLDGGAWTKVSSSLFITGGYNGQFSLNPGSPAAGFTDNEAAWVENVGSAGSFSFVQVNLSSLSGENISFRFRFGGDDNTNAEGWYIDAFNITAWNYTKSIIPMYSGLPFYTITQNPGDYLNFSCLANMKAGETCNTTWEVNASGKSGKTYSFFTIYQVENYSQYVNGSNTSIVNITIIDNIAPTVSAIDLLPEYPLPTSDLNCTFTITDASALDVLTTNVSWYLGGVYNQSSIVSVKHGVETIAALGSGNTSLGQVWHCGVTPYDQRAYGAQVNSTNRTITLTVPPVINEIQCQQNGSVWTDCSNLVFGDVLSGVRVNCTSQNDYVTNATFNFTNIPDANTYFYNTTTLNQTDWWIFYQNVTLNNSGEFKLDVVCNDNNSVTDNEYVNWSLPWGTLSSSLVSPDSDTSVQKNEFFSFSAQISCTGGECGNIDATLDPGFQEQSPTNGTPDAGRIIDVGGSDEEDGDYTDTQSNDGNYYLMGELDWGQASSQMELDFNVSNISLDYSKNITSLNLTLTYCHSGENTIALFTATGCDGDDPLEKTIDTDQDVWIYNFVTDTWVDIGNLDATNGESEVTGTFIASGTLSEYVNDSKLIRVRTEIVTGGATNSLEAMLAIEEAVLSLTYENVKGGGPVSTTVGAFPFYTTDANPLNYSYEGCLGNLIPGAGACVVTWQVNATGELNTTHEFWVIFNSSNHDPYVAETETSHIYITITDASLVPPIVILEAPADNYVTSNPSVVFNCSATDNLGLSNMTLYGDFLGSFQANGTNSLSGTSNSTIFSRTLNDGIFTWNCLGYDTDGNSDWGLANRTLTVDHVAPSINLSEPQAGESFVVGTIEFNFTVTDAIDPTLNCNLTIDTIVRDADFVVSNGSLTSRTVNNLAQGTHYWNVTCWDDAGNVNTSETRNFSITDLPPTVVLITADSLSQSSTTINLSYNATDNNNVTEALLYINGILNQTETNVTNGSIMTFVVIGLAEGKYNWTVNVTDISNLTAQASVRWFTIDFTPPSINLSAPDDNYSTNDGNVTFNMTVIDNFDIVLSCNLTVNGSVLDTGFDANNGSLTTRFVVIPDGVSYWNVTCWDDAGNVNTSETRMINVSSPPTVQLDSPADGFSQNSATISLFYTPIDNTGFASCDLLLNGGFNQTNNTPVSNGVQNNFTLNGLGTGNYTWTVNCTDTFGLTGIAFSWTFIIDVVEPGIALYNPLPNETIYSDIINFNYTASDDFDQNLTCNLTLDGSVNQSDIVSLNGTPTNLTVIVSTDGIHYWNVTCWDDAGNVNTSETRNFTSMIPPTVTLYAPAPNTILDYGININFSYIPSDSDGIDNASFIIDGIVNQTDYTVANKNYNNFYVNLSDGVYNWTVKATDTNGLTGTTETRVFTVDTTAPLVTINYPTEGATVTTNNVSLNFTVTDNLDSELICNISINDTPIYTNITAANGSTIVRYVTSNDGSYNWVVRCIDHANNTNTPVTTNFMVTAPPTVSLHFPINNYRTSNQTITFNYTPYDAIGFENCSLYIDGVFNRSNSSIIKNVPNFFTLTGIAGGNYNWTVMCIDETPDLNPYTAAAENFTIDLLGPSITLNYPGEGDTLNSNNVTFNWTPTDEPGVNISCNLYVDGLLNKTSINGTSGTDFTQLVTNLTDGDHNWSVNCSDDLGNWDMSVTGNFTINQPDLQLFDGNLSFNDTNPDPDENITISADISNIGGIPTTNVLVSFYDGKPGAGGTLIGNDTVATIGINASATASVTWLIPEGFHTVWVLVDPLDVIGELNETNNNATINISTLVSRINLPLDGTIFNVTTFTVNFTVADYRGGTVNYTVLVNAAPDSNGVANDNQSATEPVTRTDGTYTIVVRATDDLSRTKDSSSITIYIDTGAPQVTWLTANESAFNTSTVTVDFNITDATSTNISYEFYLDGSLNRTGNATNGVAMNETITGLSEGIHTIYITATDEVGNAGNSTTLTIYVDFTPPVPNIETTDGSWFNTNTPDIDFNITDNLDDPINYTFIVDGNPDAAGEASNGTSTSDTLSALSEGSHIVRLEAFDDALNTGNSSNITIWIDVTDPNIQLHNPLQNETLPDQNVTFNFTTTDNLDNLLNCTLWVSGEGSFVMTAQNGTPKTYNISDVGFGIHFWNVTCTDEASNSNTSETWNFTIPAPDLVITSGNITFSNSTPVEGQNITVNATIFNIGNTTAENFTVQFWLGDPDNGGSQINGDFNVTSLISGANITFTVNHTAVIGQNDIYVVVDAPTATNGTVSEDDETNNKAYNTFQVGLYHIFTGTTNNLLRVADGIYLPVWTWNVTNATGSNVLIADTDSSLDFLSLQALGRDTSNNSQFEDFYELDQQLSSENNSDSVNQTWTNSGSPIETRQFDLFNVPISNVPIINSTNVTAFKTGILWDTSDGGAEYDGTQDVAFITLINESKAGSRGTYDYEARIPAPLSGYTGATPTVTFYVELT